MSWTDILVALIGAGLLKYAVDFLKWLSARRKAHSSEGRQAVTLNTVDQSLSIVAKARDELEADNTRLRKMINEERDRWDDERVRWETREAAMRREIEELERKLRDVLNEVQSFKIRHSPGPATGPQPRV